MDMQIIFWPKGIIHAQFAEAKTCRFSLPDGLGFAGALRRQTPVNKYITDV